MDLGCERCARVYLAIFRRGGISWMNEIVRDTRMHRRSVKRHLSRLLTLGLLADYAIPGYKIVKELDSVKCWRQKQDVNCDGCGKVYLALLKNNGSANLDQITRKARMKRRTVEKHLNHLLDLGVIEQSVVGIYRVRKQR